MMHQGISISNNKIIKYKKTIGLNVYIPINVVKNITKMKDNASIQRKQHENNLIKIIRDEKKTTF